MIASLSMAALMVCVGAPDVVKWTFETDSDVKAWVTNGHLANVKAKDGVYSADAVDWDPFFVCKGVEFRATAWQFILLRIKADKPGQGQIFWSGQTTGAHDGFSAKKTTQFRLKGTGDWENVTVFPFWQAEGTIRQLRLDVYEGARFDIDSVRILTWGDRKPPVGNVYSWKFGGDTRPWQVHPASDTLLSPRLRLPVDDKTWITVRARSDKAASAEIVWASQGVLGMQSQAFSLRAGRDARYHNVEMAGIKNWRTPVLALGIRLAKDANVRLESIAIGEEPAGPPEIEAAYFGLQDGAMRAGSEAGVIVQFRNHGGTAVEPTKFRLSLPDGLKLAGGKLEQVLEGLDYDDQKTLTWRVIAEKPGDYRAKLTGRGVGAPESTTATLRFLPPLNLPKADYVPKPRPIRTDLDVCAYYFPGWQLDAKWDCVRRVAPIRKPVLGYYDEANVECVDWQIKWAVENGIKCFLVDWYWNKGNKGLEHWFNSYRKARYRDYLKVAVMWANHIPPKSHSPEDWRNVTREWIEKYFTLDSYYHIDGKPAVFLWSPTNIRRDLGGSQAVARSFAESQAMAKAAGHKGITFLAMFGHESKSGVEALLEEGYYGATNYHEWGDAPSMVDNRRATRFQDIVTTVRKTWEQKVARCGKLVYYPVVDTGWDARPWHGGRARVIGGRTPARFEDILRQAKTYCKEIGRNAVVLGPVNEWGEGSYIEPNTEFGFEMCEAIRRVFGKGDPSSWPVNVAPRDVGRGGYEFKITSVKGAWTFDKDAGGWGPMMSVSDMAVKDGKLRFKTTSRDPAIMAGTGGWRARKYTKAVFRMRIVGKVSPGEHAQVFFSVAARSVTEATSFRFPLATDGKMHTYTVDLTKVPRWRNRITTLRFDPCGTKDVEVIIDEIRLK